MTAWREISESHQKTPAILTQARASSLIAAMSDAPRITLGKRVEIGAKEARLAEALRDNLRRRKEQARAREKRAGGLPDDQGANDEPPA